MSPTRWRLLLGANEVHALYDYTLSCIINVKALLFGNVFWQKPSLELFFAFDRLSQR